MSGVVGVVWTGPALSGRAIGGAWPGAEVVVVQVAVRDVRQGVVRRGGRVGGGVADVERDIEVAEAHAAGDEGGREGGGWL